MTDDAGLSIESDHSSLYWQFKMSTNKQNNLSKTQNPLKRIKHWESFRNILEKRLTKRSEEFKTLSGHEQGILLTEEIQTSGLSVLPGQSTHKKNKGVITNRMKKLLKNSKMIRKRLKLTPTMNHTRRVLLCKEAKLVSEEIKVQFRKESIQYKRKIQNQLKGKGPESQKLLWSLVMNKSKKPVGIEVLEDDGSIITDQKKKAEVVENFFIKKFNTTYDKSELVNEAVEDEAIGYPETVMGKEASEQMMRLITMQELNEHMAGLKSDKAEGIDGITNEILKQTGPIAREMILTLFNNVMIGGSVPSSWKEGDIVLILKKPPMTDINNYRPITLISCISKLLTKILPKDWQKQ